MESLESSAAASLQMAVETVGSAVETVGTVVASGIGMVGELGSAVEERLFHAEENLLQTGGAFGAALGGAVSERIEAATSTLAQQANAAVGDTFAAVEHAGAAVGETIDAVEDAIESVERSVEEFVSDGLRAVGAELGAARDGVGAVVQSAVAPFRALSAEAVHSAVGVVSSEMREGVKDLTTDAQVMALRVEEKLLAFNSSLHGLASRVVGALQRQQSADLAATAAIAAAAAAAPPSLEADANEGRNQHAISLDPSGSPTAVAEVDQAAKIVPKKASKGSARPTSAPINSEPNLEQDLKPNLGSNSSRNSSRNSNRAPPNPPFPVPAQTPPKLPRRPAYRRRSCHLVP